VEFYLLFRVLLFIDGLPEPLYFKETNITYYKTHSECVENGYKRLDNVMNIFKELEIEYTNLEFRCLEQKYD
jgi:hypothetical protein